MNVLGKELPTSSVPHGQAHGGQTHCTVRKSSGKIREASGDSVGNLCFMEFSYTINGMYKRSHSSLMNGC